MKPYRSTDTSAEGVGNDKLALPNRQENEDKRATCCNATSRNICCQCSLVFVFLVWHAAAQLSRTSPRCAPKMQRNIHEAAGLINARSTSKDISACCIWMDHQQGQIEHASFSCFDGVEETSG